jgi:site-specific DNA-cytosine methylase
VSPRHSDLTLTDMFCGAGGSSIGAHHVGLTVRLAMNHWKRAIETHNTNFPDTDHACTDIQACEPRAFYSTDILVASPECFPAGTLVLTDRGYRPIEDIVVGDRVLTHVGRYQLVTETMQAVRQLKRVVGQGHPGLLVSGEHPIYARAVNHVWNNRRRMYERTLQPPEWRKVTDLRTGAAPSNRAGGDRSFWATPCAFPSLSIPKIGGRGMDITPAVLWMVGRYLGDGWSRDTESRAELVITCGLHEMDALRERLHLWPRESARAGRNELAWAERITRTAGQFATNHRGLVEWIREQFGHGAAHKHIPAWLLGASEDLRRALLNGYLSADGSAATISGNTVTSAVTISKRLAFSLRALAESLNLSVNVFGPYKNRDVIEGRKVNTRPFWVVRWRGELQRAQNVRDGHLNWLRLRRLEDIETTVPVYNLAVFEDESFVVEGVVVHNCTNHSLAKGVKRKISQIDAFSDASPRAEEIRSRATMWDVPRFAEVHRYRAIIVENVVDARHWVMFDAWLMAMQALGYQHRCVYLNSMFAHPTPQSRDRMYIVFWQRGNRAPDLEIRPAAPCGRCAVDVEAVQSWKPGRDWGRYKRQYLYCCPRCGHEVQPYYFAALNAIDWSLPAERIGDRTIPLKAKTRARIAYGMERFGRQPLVVHTRMTHNAPQPVILNASHGGAAARAQSAIAPMPTQTTAQELAVAVPPAAVLTYRNQPGVGYPVRSVGDPFATVVGETQERLVLAPAALVTLRDMKTIGQLVRPLDAPMGTQVASATQDAIVSRTPYLIQYYGQGESSGIGQAVPTVTTVDRNALVEPGPTPDVDDCFFRMLQPHEVGGAMAFPASYVVTGTKREQVKQYGNAVTPPAMRMLLARVLEALTGERAA